MATPGIFVLSTQKVSADLIRSAAASGVQLDVLPFIHIELLAGGEWPAKPGIAVFTSQHAVEAMPAPGPGWTVFCLEGATRRLAENRFGTGIVRGTAPSAAELANVIIDSGAGKEILFLCGDRRREELPVVLQQAGITVEERIVYQTVLTPHRLDREYTGIAFFSPSGVESFFSVNDIPAGTTIFALGRTTAAAVRTRTGREAIPAGQPDKELLIQEMIAHFKV